MNSPETDYDFDYLVKVAMSINRSQMGIYKCETVSQEFFKTPKLISNCKGLQGLIPSECLNLCIFDPFTFSTKNTSNGGRGYRVVSLITHIRFEHRP